MDKKTEQNGNHFLTVGNGSAKSKEQEARDSMTKSTSGLSSLRQKETIVTISNGEKGCYFSRLQVGVFVFVLLLTLSVMVVLVVCFSGSNRYYHKINSPFETVCDCAENQASYATEAEETASYQTPLPIRSKSADQPEIGIRLPGDVIPIHYDIELDVSIEKERYTGSVKILTTVLKETRLLILHAAPYILQINEDDIYIYLFEGEHTDNTSAVIPIVKQFMDFNKDIHAIELKEPMQEGLQYIVYIKQFHGLILADLKGMYMSSYKDKDGGKR